MPINTGNYPTRGQPLEQATAAPGELRKVRRIADVKLYGDRWLTDAATELIEEAWERIDATNRGPVEVFVIAVCEADAAE